MKIIMQTGKVRGKTNHQGLIFHVRLVCLSVNPFCTRATTEHTNGQGTNLVLPACRDIAGTG